MILIKRKKLCLLLTVVLLLSGIVLAINTVAAVQIWGDLTGTVTDADTGLPITGVTITAVADVVSDAHDSGTTTTDTLGQYTINELNGNHPVGKSYSVTAEKTGYVTAAVNGVLIYSAADGPAVVTTQDFVLEKIKANAVFGTTPIIDGTISLGEWDDAEEIDFLESVFIKRNCSHLNIAFLYEYSADPPNPDADRAVVLFDVNHDNGSAPKVDDLQLILYYNGTMAEKQGTNSGWTSASPTGWEAQRGSYMGISVYEFSIPYQKIAVTSGQANTLGFALGYYVTEKIGLESYWWPRTVANPNVPDSWTDLIFPDKATIESVDSVGDEKNTFMLGETIRVKGSGYAKSTIYDVSIVKDQNWTDGMAIPQYGFDEDCVFTEGFQSSTTGEIGVASIMWMILDPSTYSAGKYDIVVDVNDNGVYEECIDALDDLDVESAGLFVVPEVPMGTIMATISMFAALIGFNRFRPKLRLK